MKRLFVIIIFMAVSINVFSLDLADVRKSLNKPVETEVEVTGYDWIVIPEINYEPPKVELPDGDIYTEKEVESENFFKSFIIKMKDFLQSLKTE
jgi:heme/copper-type cytochrome/quinol oxidase subunit 2